MALKYRGLVLATMLALAASGCEQDSGIANKGVPTPAPDSAEDTEWSLHGNDFGEQRYSALDLINRKNTSDLGLAWYYDIPTRRGIEATPLMVDRTLYVTGA